MSDFAIGLESFIVRSYPNRFLHVMASKKANNTRNYHFFQYLKMKI